MYKVTVIVPVYKAEKYIERCAVSLFEQTLDDIEYIFVNDGTPDKSIEVLDCIINRYPKRKNSVRIISKENGGLASARTCGILAANGEYVIHCDSDDWVDLNLYELLYEKAKETGAEMVICPVTEVSSKGTFVRNWGNLGYSCQEVLKNWYKDCVQMYTHNKLVKSSVLKSNNLLPYEGINMWEDNGLMLRVFYYAKGLAQIDNATYYYNRDNENAITCGYGRQAVDQMIQCASNLYDFFKRQRDFEVYEKTALAIKFFARINLVATSFSGLREYYRLFPETDAVIPYIGKKAFSPKGFLRFKFVKNNLAWLFILLFKIKSWVEK